MQHQEERGKLVFYFYIDRFGDNTKTFSRNFLMKVQAGRQLRESNPKCEINEIIKEDMSPAVVEVEYGTSLTLSLVLKFALAHAHAPRFLSGRLERCLGSSKCEMARFD